MIIQPIPGGAGGVQLASGGNNRGNTDSRGLAPARNTTNRNNANRNTTVRQPSLVTRAANRAARRLNGNSGGGRYTVNVGAARSDPEQGAADLTRAQYEYFESRIKPIEGQALGAIQNERTPIRAANRAAATVRRAYRKPAYRGLEERAIEPYGVDLTGDERRVIQRRRGLEEALGVAGAWNTTYNASRDVVTSAAGDALQIGRGVAGQAARGLGAAAESFVGARSAQEAQAAANQQSRFNTVASAAGLGAALAPASFKFAGMSGPLAGGVVGAGVGLIASFL